MAAKATAISATAAMVAAVTIPATLVVAMARVKQHIGILMPVAGKVATGEMATPGVATGEMATVEMATVEVAMAMVANSVVVTETAQAVELGFVQQPLEVLAESVASAAVSMDAETAQVRWPCFDPSTMLCQA